MKKFRVIVSSVMVIFSVTACGGEKASDNKADLLELGLEVAEIMQEMVYSDEYISAFTNSEYAEEIERFRADDYDSPTAVYSVEMTSVKDTLLLLGYGDDADYDKLSGNLKEQLNYKVSFSTVVGALNVKNGGIETIALCSALTAIKYDKDIELNGEIAYIYVFEKGVPIAVTFDESGRAYGSFILLGDNKSYEDISKTFEKYYCTVEKIK